MAEPVLMVVKVIWSTVDETRKKIFDKIRQREEKHGNYLKLELFFHEKEVSPPFRNKKSQNCI